MASGQGRCVFFVAAASEKLPQQTSGTVLSKDELKRRLSENSLRRPQPEERAAQDEYAKPNKVKQIAAAAARRAAKGKRQVSFDDEVAAPGRETLVRVTTRHTTLERTMPPTVEEEENSEVQLRRGGVAKPEITTTSSNTGSLEATVNVYEDECGEVRGVVELSTLRQTRVPRIKVRVVCLIDASGSMLLKGDKRKLRSKIAILKNMAVDIIDALEDDEDFFGVMTFGDETRVVCPLTKVSSAARTQVKQTISKLDESAGFSANTDLSSALVEAVNMLAKQQQDECLLYRNCIIVFSDGEVNAGEVDPKNLVHVVREKIRECSVPQDILADLWVNISCVTTGSSFSQCLYLVSKLCGSDAYFFVDGDRAHPEAEMLIPLMLRKTACAQMVSVTVRAGNGAILATDKCSQEYSIRRRRTGNVEKGTMAYFLHDVPVGSHKTFTIALDVGGVRKSLGQDFLFVDVQYVDSVGVLHGVYKRIGLQEVVSLKENKEQYMPTDRQQRRHQSDEAALQKTCRNVANLLEDTGSSLEYDDDGSEAIVWAVTDGKKELQRLRKEFGTKLEGDPLKDEFDHFADAVEANLNKLKQILQQNSKSPGKCWQYAKAMSSAVVRELPTVSNVLAHPRVVCPLPEAEGCESRRTHALSLYVFGGEEEAAGMYSDQATVLHNAVSDVAKTLADVLKMLEPGFTGATGESP
ncbi:hypothetical protein BaRGS_00011616 [Batillaria attramentaria]|uniref:VWFA domain-containing protein n=1 Tax=Batillaria attramentaria TaxID=370345 RepID=A0ABD0LD63_9CAEN